MDNQSGRRVWDARRITAVYLLAGVVWILFSDALLAGLGWGVGAILTAQTAKGSLFVGGSSLLLYVLVAREERALAATNDELEQSLRHVSVLHRVLRHNLRNSCDVIRNNVDLLETEAVDECACHDRIARQADHLTAIAEKSRHLRDIVLDDVEPTLLSVEAVVDEAVATVQTEVPGVRFERSVEPGAEVYAHPRFVVAVEELLYNAATHHDEASPLVAVSASREDDRTTIEIVDDGPGLPESELTALAGEFEAPLSHAHGVGLWLVRFLVDDSGGDLEVTSGEDGTVVRLRLPATAKRTADEASWHGGENPLTLS